MGWENVQYLFIVTQACHLFIVITAQSTFGVGGVMTVKSSCNNCFRQGL